MAGIGGIWEFEGDGKVFQRYAGKDSDALERAFSAGSLISVGVNNGKCEVDLKGMVQRNLATGKIRRVRRKEMQVLCS